MNRARIFMVFTTFCSGLHCSPPKEATRSDAIERRDAGHTQERDQAIADKGRYDTQSRPDHAPPGDSLPFDTVATAVHDSQSGRLVSDSGSKDLCSNTCSPNGKRSCANAGYRICGQYDTDPCLEWSPIRSCDANETCDEGACVPSCQQNGNTCSQSGQCCSKLCSGGKCCLETGACSKAADCCSGYACVGGTCRQACVGQQRCTSNDNCCPNEVCNLFTNQCNGTCYKSGEKCKADTMCCAGLSCYGGTCTACGNRGDSCAPSYCCMAPYVCNKYGMCDLKDCASFLQFCSTSTKCCLSSDPTKRLVCYQSPAHPNNPRRCEYVSP